MEFLYSRHMFKELYSIILIILIVIFIIVIFWKINLPSLVYLLLYAVIHPSLGTSSVLSYGRLIAVEAFHTQ